VPARGKTPRGNETILYAEDYDTVRQFASLELRELGYTVLEGKSVKEALAVAHQYKGRIHLLLTDMILPDISGQELANVLTREMPGIKVLFTSGYTETQLAQRGLKVPTSALLEKPFMPETLAKKVREILGPPSENPAGNAGSK
jgi:CheY-like chemotaxis protein